MNRLISLLFAVHTAFWLDVQTSNFIYAQEHDDEASCDVDGVCTDEDNRQPIQTQEQELFKDSSLCSSSTDNQQHLATIYDGGLTAQSYKPDAPIKTSVCEASSSNSHNVAHWPFWRSKYGNVVSLVVHGNIYSCGKGSSLLHSSSSNVIMEVWQPSTDGTYSSLRSGIDEGACRASVPINKTINNEFSNLVGQVQYETLAPGSPGILGGLVPDSSRDYPPYAPGAVNMFLNIEGYHPLLGQLDMNSIEAWLLLKDSQGRFRFKGWDIRPHASKSKASVGLGGIEIRSVQKASRSGYDLAFEVGVDIYLVGEDQNIGMTSDPTTHESVSKDVFCTSYWYFSFSWISSFFREPIAVCFPSLLDFFAL